MPCYVDPLFDTRGWSDQWPFPEACHLMADSDEELHALAARLGLKRAWHQPRPPHSVSHYDLTRRKRRAAVMAGAIEVDRGFFPERERRRNPLGDRCCEHGTALDVHCCGEGGLPYPGCHSGFLFNPESCRCKL